MKQKTITLSTDLYVSNMIEFKLSSTKESKILSIKKYEDKNSKKLITGYPVFYG